MSRNCFVPQCYEGYKSQRKKTKLNGNISNAMFKAPKDTLLLEKWTKAIQRTDRKLRPGIDCVCEKHFDETCLDRYYETKMLDGSIHRIERGRLRLKKNAIPTIFPDSPHYLTRKKQKKKAMLEPNTYLNDNISNTVDNISETFNNLHGLLKSMKLPDHWFFSFSHGSLVLGYLDSNFDLIKKIIISDNDLNFKVFIKNKLVNVTQLPATCFEDIKTILKTVDDFKMCPGTGIDNCLKSDQCCEYFNFNVLSQVQRCVECEKFRKCNMDIQKQKNVCRAYRFFGEITAVSKEIYTGKHIDLSKCKSTVDCAQHINSLINSMDYHTSNYALQKHSSEYQAFKDFQQYLETWNNTTQEKGYFILTNSTYNGLQISLKATLEVFDYLQLACDLTFLKTSPLNQDILERFFSIAKNSCSPEDHPDTILFIQIFMIIRSYSLLKPFKNLSICDKRNLLSSVHDLNIPDNKRLPFQKIIDSITENGCNDPDMSSFNALIEHNYSLPKIDNISVTNDLILAFISGYVARIATRFTNCVICLNSLKTYQTFSQDLLTKGTYHGNLLKPSTSLFNLIKSLEFATQEVMAKEELSVGTIFKVLDIFKEVKSSHLLVGCSNKKHKKGLTLAILNFFLITKMHFICSKTIVINSVKKYEP